MSSDSEYEEYNEIVQTSYLIASVSFDRHLNIYSFKSRQQVYSVDSKFYLQQICYHRPTKKLLIRTYDYEILEVDMNVRMFKDRDRMNSMATSLKKSELVKSTRLHE